MTQAATLKKNRDLIAATDLVRTYRMGGRDLQVLRGVDFHVASGEWVAIVGSSGSGKSTLLHLLGGLDRPDQGDVLFKGQSVFHGDARAVDTFRGTHVGFVFQFYHLLPELTALDNVVAGAMVTNTVFQWLGQRDAVYDRAAELLTQLGLAERLTHRPSKLSGGERQRVAIARALINEPDVLLADEPTGNLDAVTGAQILDVFRKLHQQGQTIVMVTHDQKVAAAADRCVRLENGRL